MFIVHNADKHIDYETQRRVAIYKSSKYDKTTLFFMGLFIYPVEFTKK